MAKFGFCQVLEEELISTLTMISAWDEIKESRLEVTFILPEATKQ